MSSPLPPLRIGKAGGRETDINGPEGLQEFFLRTDPFHLAVRQPPRQRKTTAAENGRGNCRCRKTDKSLSGASPKGKAPLLAGGRRPPFRGGKKVRHAGEFGGGVGEGPDGGEGAAAGDGFPDEEMAVGFGGDLSQM